MKQCTYCGKEYPDDTARCLIDGEALAGPETQLATTSQKDADSSCASSVSVSDRENETVKFPRSERQFRVMELVLVCVVAFGSSILASTFVFLGYSYGNS